MREELEERLVVAFERIATALEKSTENNGKERKLTEIQRTSLTDAQLAQRKQAAQWRIQRKSNGEQRKSNGEQRKVTDSVPSVGPFIATYIKAWQSRYGTKARPDVGGKTQGILKRLSRDNQPDRLASLIQVFCQMENEWFVRKRHDLGTLEQNLNVVALALDKGHERTDTNWEKIFGESTGDEQRQLPETTGPDVKDVGREELPPRANLNILEGLAERIRR